MVTTHVPYRCVLPRLSCNKREVSSMVPGRTEVLDLGLEIAAVCW